MCQKTFLVKKNYWVEFFWGKILWVQKNLCRKKIRLKNYCVKKILCQRSFWVKKNLVEKHTLVEKIFGKKNFRVKKIWLQIFFCLKKTGRVIVRPSYFESSDSVLAVVSESGGGGNKIKFRKK